MQGRFAPWLALAACISLSAAASVAAGSSRDVCRVVEKGDIFRLLGWTVDHVRARSYRFGALTGRMCNFESSQGIVTTIVPDPGTPFPGITADNTPDAGDLVRDVPGLGAHVAFFNGAIFVTRDRKRAAVRVVPESHPASYADVEPFAKVIVAHLK